MGLVLLSGGDAVLTEGQLKRLSEHKYSSSGTTLLDPLMQRFWNCFVQRIPVSIAPNVLTVAGLVVNAVTSLILVAYSPDARQEVSCGCWVRVSQSDPDCRCGCRYPRGRWSCSPSDSSCTRRWMPATGSRRDGRLPRRLWGSCWTMAATRCPRSSWRWLPASPSNWVTTPTSCSTSASRLPLSSTQLTGRPTSLEPCSSANSTSRRLSSPSWRSTSSQPPVAPASGLLRSVSLPRLATRASLLCTRMHADLSCLHHLPVPTQIPLAVASVELRLAMTVFTLGGAVFNIFWYLTSICSGGIGKNGSTIAVSPLSCCRGCKVVWLRRSPLLPPSFSLRSTRDATQMSLSSS